MPCDETDSCPYPGEPGYAGALEAENVELAQLYQQYKALGAWAIDQHRQALSPRQGAELVWIFYELELENTRLKQAHPEVRLLWDACGGQ